MGYAESKIDKPTPAWSACSTLSCQGIGKGTSMTGIVRCLRSALRDSTCYICKRVSIKQHWD